MIRIVFCLYLMCMVFCVSASDKLVLTQEDRAMLQRLQAVRENADVIKELLIASQVVGPLTASGPLELTITLAQLDLSGTTQAAMSMNVISRCRMLDEAAIYVAQGDIKGDRYKYWKRVIESLDNGCDAALDRR